MLDDDPGPYPRRPASKIALIVVSLVVFFALCFAACAIADDILGPMACGITHIDTQDECP
ncbi:MAG TPA: hypothetical protein VFC00_20270 [Micromonosporaceae bacterium]|nr:hypothetical protein [Micromonosporaceae bacterium]